VPIPCLPAEPFNDAVFRAEDWQRLPCSLRLGSVSYTHSLRTQDEREAEVRIGQIRDMLYRLEQGTLQMPQGGGSQGFHTLGRATDQQASA